jgi:CheY-like chemotaxis protein
VDRCPSLVALMFSNAARLFPRKAEARTMTQTAELTTSNRTVASPRILVVDDEVCIADLLSEMLRILGYTPTACNSPLTALELLASQEFDVVLSDFRMPHLNGDEFFRRVVSEHPELRSRFVFLTGDTMSEGTHDFMTGQRSRYICKPFDIATVQQVITDIVSQEAA